MAMVNPIINPMQVKDSRWLTLEVCREFTRNKCTRTELECKFAHPPPNVEVQNGRVTCCFDSIKGKCQRKDPPCKYLHPPQHLREQLLQNGKNNLILKNLQMQAMAAGLVPSPISMPVGVLTAQQGAPYMAMQNPQMQYMTPGQFQLQPAASAGQMTTLHGLDASTAAQLTATSMNNHMPGVMHQQSQGVSPQSKAPRPDRLESSGSTCTSSTSSSTTSEHTTLPAAVSWAGTPAFVDGLAGAQPGSSPYPSLYLQPPQMVEVLSAANAAAAAAAAAAAGKKRPRDPGDELFLGMSAVPGMMPMVKRQAIADNKSGIPMYQPNAGTTAYQQAALAAMSLQQQPFVPVTSHYTVTGHPPSVPRF